MSRWKHPRRAAAAGGEALVYAPSEHAIRAMLDGLDHVAAEMERKWGVGRLRLLVSDLLRTRFDAQKERLDAAIATDREAYIRVQAEGMKRAWTALDQAATEAGHQPLSPAVWECVLPSTGEVISVVRTEAEAHHVARDGEVWTMAEIGLLIDRLGDTVREARGAFPGARVTDIRDRSTRRAHAAAQRVDWEKGDDIPF